MRGQNYSLWSLLKHGFKNHQTWEPAWERVALKPSYDVVIVGGGGHGLATAHYLAANHGITDVAVLERGAIGLGNVGRNTTIIRSNSFSREKIRFFDFSLKLWERFER